MTSAADYHADRNARARARLKKPCIDGCGRLAWHKDGPGRCVACAGRLRRGNGVGRPPQPALERFLRHVAPEPNTGCWLWMSFHDKDGYAMFFEKRGGEQRAHRFAYKTFVGEIPTGLVVDHLCRNRGCVNPAHLEPVTNRENVMRGRNPLRERTHCSHGHAFNETNTRWYVARNGLRHRQCRPCHAEYERNRRERMRAAA